MIRRPPRSTLLSLHDALPIYIFISYANEDKETAARLAGFLESIGWSVWWDRRSEEHTSELQSRLHLVCRLLLEKKKKNQTKPYLRYNYETNDTPEFNYILRLA